MDRHSNPSGGKGVHQALAGQSVSFTTLYQPNTSVKQFRGGRIDYIQLTNRLYAQKHLAEREWEALSSLLYGCDSVGNRLQGELSAEQTERIFDFLDRMVDGQQNPGRIPNRVICGEV